MRQRVLGDTVSFHRGCGRKLGPNFWNEVQVMYTQKEINDVLKIYDRLNSLRGTVRLLGYPSRSKLREWLRERRETVQFLVEFIQIDVRK